MPPSKIQNQKSKILHSLTIRLTALYIVGALLLVVAIALGSYLYISRYLEASLRSDLDAAAQADVQYFELAISVGGLPSDALVSNVAPRLVRLNTNRFTVRVFDPNANLLAGGPEALGIAPSSPAYNLLATDTLLLHPVFYSDPQRLYVAYPATYREETAAIIELSASRDSINRVLLLLGRVYIIALLIAAFIAALGGLWLARTVSRPIRNIAATAEQIAAGSDAGLGARVGDEVRRRDEIGALAHSLNEMADRLQALLASRNTFVSSIGHELRTPLTTLKGNIINLQDDPELSPDNLQALQVMEQETDRLTRLVEELLAFARSGGVAPAPELACRPFDLSTLVAELCAALEPRAARLGLRLTCAAPTHITVTADPDRVKQILINLLDNALKFSPAGGCIEVTVQPEGKMAVVRVADSGPGISVAQREAAFLPYERGEMARTTPGLGLGLSIARRLAEAHGGSLTLEANQPQGTAAVLRLPCQIKD